MECNLRRLFYSIYTVLCAVACRRVGQKHKCGGRGLHGINMGVFDREAPAGVLLLRGQAMAHNNWLYTTYPFVIATTNKTLVKIAITLACLLSLFSCLISDFR